MAVMEPSASNGEVRVPLKKDRTNYKNKGQGTSPKVRIDRLKVTIEHLTFEKATLQEKYNDADSARKNLARELARVLEERDSARTELRQSEKTSAHRLLLIKNEVPDFASSLLSGTFDCYDAAFPC